MTQRVATLYFTTNRIVGDVLREAREDTGLSQDAAADALDVARSTMSMYENGDRTVTVERMLDLARLYAIPADVLMSVIEKRLQQ